MATASYNLPEGMKEEIEALAEAKGYTASKYASILLRKALGPKAKPELPDWAEDAVEAFWKAYPRKTNGKKAKDLLRSLISKNPDREFWRSVVRDAGTRYHAVENKKFIPHATTYLNGARWEDEVIHENTRANTARTALQEASDQTRRSALHAASLIAGDDPVGADDSAVRQQVDQDGGEYI